MKKLNIALVFMCLCLGFTGNVMADGLNQILVKDKFTLIDITMDGCNSCEDLLPVIDNMKRKYGQQLEVVMVDFWKHPEIVKEIGTNTSPTIVILDKSGDEVFRHYGFIPEKVLELYIKKILDS